MSADIAAPIHVHTYRYLVDEIDTTWWDRMVSRITKEYGKTSEVAADILNEAIGFLKLCSDHPTERFSPSDQVDIGWHTALMYTQLYRRLCQSLGGRFIHHSPNDVPGTIYETGTVARTLIAMRRQGPVLEELWLHAAGIGSDCNHGQTSFCRGACDGD